MGFHTFPIERADDLEDPARYAYLSAEELRGLLGPGGRVADLGSGTGFYTDGVAPTVEAVYAVDLQRAMHERYRRKGLPDNVAPVTAAVDRLPFATDALDGAFSTMTYHEFATPEALAEVARVLRPGARLAVGDWNADGAGEEGPPRDERFSLAEAERDLTDAGFVIDRADERRETFVVAARLST